MLLWQLNNQKLRNQITVVAQLIGVLFALHLLILSLCFGVSFKKKPMRLSLQKAASVPMVLFTTVDTDTNKRSAKRTTMSKPSVQQKQPVKKTIAQKKKQVKAPVKPVAQNNKKTAQKPPAKSQQAVTEKKQPQAQQPASVAQQPAAPVEQQPKAPSLTKQEREAVILEAVLAQQIAPHFKTPSGVASTLSCRVLVSIDAQGKLHTYTIEQSSGSLLYDMAVEQALNHIEQFPAWAAGQQYSILFN